MIRVIMLAALAAVTTISYAAPAVSSDKPFADKHVVLQISDPNPFKQTLVLNVANNLIKHYGQDKVDVEIVAFGPGLRLLFKDNHNKGRISGLVSEGVRFSACGNTIHAMTKQLGHPPALNSSAKVVPGGAVRIIDLVADGYTLIKP
jgi:intracellular sulfur oxidation DsrE/DsrF family protein